MIQSRNATTGVFGISIIRHMDVAHEEEQYDSHGAILGHLENLYLEFATGLEELEAMFG